MERKNVWKTYSEEQLKAADVFGKEYMYFLEMRIMNWYDEPIMSGIDEDASSNVVTWESEGL